MRCGGGPKNLQDRVRLGKSKKGRGEEVSNGAGGGDVPDGGGSAWAGDGGWRTSFGSEPTSEKNSMKGCLSIKWREGLTVFFEKSRENNSKTDGHGQTNQGSQDRRESHDPKH